MQKIIDPHLHFFNLDIGQYHWLKSENPPYWDDKGIIQKNFSEKDLILSPHLNLESFVHVEAGFNNELPSKEIEWLEKVISKPFKSIATCNLQQNHILFNKNIEELKRFISFIGVRDIIDQNGHKLLSNQEALRNFEILNENKLIFELQIDKLSNTNNEFIKEITKAFPNIKFVLNHIGFPAYSHNNFDTIRLLKDLNQCENLYIKASGWEMMNRKYESIFVENIMSALINHFDTNKIMLASNFPLNLFKGSYEELWNNYFHMFNDEQLTHKLTYQNAKKIYNI